MRKRDVGKGFAEKVYVSRCRQKMQFVNGFASLCLIHNGKAVLVLFVIQYERKRGETK